MSYRDSRVASPDRPADMRAECEQAPGPGVLAYVDGVPAGWCSVVGTLRLFEEAGFRTAVGTTAHSGGVVRTLMRLELTGNALVEPRYTERAVTPTGVIGLDSVCRVW